MQGYKICAPHKFSILVSNADCYGGITMIMFMLTGVVFAYILYIVIAIFTKPPPKRQEEENEKKKLVVPAVLDMSNFPIVVTPLKPAEVPAGVPAEVPAEVHNFTSFDIHKKSMTENSTIFVVKFQPKYEETERLL